MATEIRQIKLEKKLGDGRASEVRVRVSVQGGQWSLDDPGDFELAAGGKVTWEFVRGLSKNDRPEIVIVPAKSTQPAFPDPFKTLAPGTNSQGNIEIVGTTLRDAQGQYTYELEVEHRAGGRERLGCTPARMGGIKVSQPPVGR